MQGVPVLSHPATVPSQMPLRALVSQSETISAPSQCRTLRRGLEAVYGPYSTSAPCTTMSTARDDTEHETPEPSRAITGLSSGPSGVAILTALTRQKSHHERAFSTAKEIGCYRQRGGGRGCDPTTPHEVLAALGPAPTFPQEINAVELSTNPVPALSALAARPPFYK